MKTEPCVSLMCLPSAFDEPAILDTLLRLKQGLAVELPIYDFARHARSEETKRVGEGLVARSILHTSDLLVVPRRLHHPCTHPHTHTDAHTHTQMQTQVQTLPTAPANSRSAGGSDRTRVLCNTGIEHGGALVTVFLNYQGPKCDIADGVLTRAATHS